VRNRIEPHGHTEEGNRMEIEETGVRNMMRRRGLRNKGMIEISQDSRTGEFVLVAARGIRRKWLMFNFPEAMWKVRGSKDEVLAESKRLLEETILAD